jgi:hypothetical protein
MYWNDRHPECPIAGDPDGDLARASAAAGRLLEGLGAAAEPAPAHLPWRTRG